MDGNRDESQRCIDLAKTAILNNDTDKAIKYLSKAQRLYPSEEAEVLLETLSNLRRRHSKSDETDGQNSTDNQNGSEPQDREDSPRHRSRSNSRSRNDQRESTSGHSHSHVEYSEEQVIAVNKIKRCKDYYEILGVTKEANEADIKKQYRKLALQFHPDKNRAPGAGEAFKMVGNAFAILSDKDKKRQYDLYGSEEQQRRRSNHTSYYENGYYEYNRGFESDINADEIFNMFFGGGFPNGNVYVRRNRYRNEHRQHQQQEVANGYNVLLQMMPVLVLLLLSLMSTFLVSDPAYSLSKTSKYQFERKTNNLEVPYFVKENFEKENKGSIRRIEQQVEEDYVSNLRASCFRERNYRKYDLESAELPRPRPRGPGEGTEDPIV